MAKIDKLKYAVFYEWSEDPPCGCVTLYNDHWCTTYKGLLGLAEQTYDDNICQVYDEEADELEEAYKAVKASHDSILHYGWENGGLGCGCHLLAVGTEIAEKVSNFYYEISEEPSEEDEQIIKVAVDNPKDYNAVIRLLDLVSEAIEKHNRSMWG